jgi:hypothetical protein
MKERDWNPVLPFYGILLEKGLAIQSLTQRKKELDRYGRSG